MTALDTRLSNLRAETGMTLDRLEAAARHLESVGASVVSIYIAGFGPPVIQIAAPFRTGETWSRHGSAALPSWHFAHPFVGVDVRGCYLSADLARAVGCPEHLLSDVGEVSP